MYFNINFNACFFKFIKVLLLVSELYIRQVTLSEIRHMERYIFVIMSNTLSRTVLTVCRLSVTFRNICSSKTLRHSGCMQTFLHSYQGYYGIHIF